MMTIVADTTHVDLGQSRSSGAELFLVAKDWYRKPFCFCRFSGWWVQIVRVQQSRFYGVALVCGRL
ncbi:MAG: hypothetical protein K8R75_00025 [Deltaproteobacteria bacterium]|nr:hypothetical protein [Deltaproteobacteria bacterium]